MKTFTSETFECVFCGYAAPVTVCAELGGAQRALAATRCPRCSRRVARGRWFAALASLGAAFVAAFLTLAMILRVIVGTSYRNPQIVSWAGNWVFGVAIGIGAAVALWSFVHQWRGLGRVVFVRRPALPVAIVHRAR